MNSGLFFSNCYSFYLDMISIYMFAGREAMMGPEVLPRRLPRFRLTLHLADANVT